MKKILIFILSIFIVSYGKEQNQEFKFDKKIIYIGVPALTLSFLLDNSVKNFTQKNKSNSLNSITDIFNVAGSGYAIALPISTYALGEYKKDEKLAKTSRVAIASSVIAASIVFPIKYITHRKRPDNSDYYSFPSGHTAFAFAIFGSYAKFYKEGITPYILYSIPVLTGFSRIYKNKHYFSDVVGGAIIGLSSVYLGEWIEKKLSIKWGIGGYIRISKKEALIDLKYRF